MIMAPRKILLCVGHFALTLSTIRVLQNVHVNRHVALIDFGGNIKLDAEKIGKL